MPLETKAGDRRWLYKSANTGLTTTVTESIEASMQHVAIGVLLRDSGENVIDAEAVSLSGTVTIMVKTENTDQWEAPPNSEIDIATPSTVTVAGNITAVRAVPASLAGTGLDHYVLVVTANREG